MIERFTDSLKKAASRAEEFTRSAEENKPKLFVDFIDGLKVAAGSAHQLAHAQMNPLWLNVRDRLEKVIEVGQTLPTFSGEQNNLWIGIKNSLLMLVESGNKMYLRKALPYQQVDKLLDIRKAALNVSLKDG